MYQTGYKGISKLSINTGYIGGMCKWWYTPVENILTWPAIDPLTQHAKHKPAIKDGSFWYGPVTASNRQLGFDEKQKDGMPGNYYEWKVEGQCPGDDRINLQNLPFHKYIILGVARTGNFWYLIGTQFSPLDFVHSINTGKHWTDDVITKLLFEGENRNKALRISFTAEELESGPSLENQFLATEDLQAILTEDGEQIII